MGGAEQGRLERRLGGHREWIVPRAGTRQWKSW